MQKSIIYYGKTTSSSCAMILMKLFHMCDFKYPFYNYITTEIFNYQGIKENQRKWFCSYPYGVDALCTGIRIIGIDQKISTQRIKLTNNGNFNRFLKEQINDGSCILGPINFSSAWDSMESRYFQGYAQFAYISDIESDYYILQDSNGCPQLRVTSEMLWSMVKDYEDISLIDFDVSQYKPRDINAIGTDIFKHIISNRLKLIGAPNNFLYCMKKLSVNFQTKSIKSSELLSLKYVLCNLNRSLYFWVEFTQYFKSICSCNELKSSIDQVISIIEEYMKKIDCLYSEERNQFNMKKIVTVISLYEKYLDSYSKILQKQIGDFDV